MKKNIHIHIRGAIFIVCLLVGTATTEAQHFFDIYRNGKVVKRIEANLVDSIAFGTTGASFLVFDKNKTRLYSATRRTVDSVTIKYVEDYSSYPELNILSGYNNIVPSYDSETGVYKLLTTGSDPYIQTKTLTTALPEDSCVLTFEYNCPAGINSFQVFFGPPVAESYSVTPGHITPTIGTEWRTYSLPIKTYRDKLGWGESGNFMRFDFGTLSDVEISLRKIRLRSMNDEEQREQYVRDSIETAKTRMAENLKAYLSTTYNSKITLVNVEKDSVEINGVCSGEGTFLLADVAPYEDVTEETEFESVNDLQDKSFTVRLPRFVRRSGLQYDRLLSKWAIVKVEDGRHVLASHARYADEVATISEPEEGVLKSKKGIAAGFGSTYISDFDNLQVHSITQNIVLNTFISTKYSVGAKLHSYGGRKYYINTANLATLDEVTKAAYERGVIVSGILLTSTGSIFDDPENNGGYYTMPNMTTAIGVNTYAAALDFLAQRYSGATYGRIHHWIMHNEVDMGDTWTNMGSQPEMRYYDRYIKSMRMCYNIVRQYDQHASVLGSYTHNWNIPGTEYSPRLMLEQNVMYSEKEGDFRWGVAYHPYPINLTRPEFWNNDIYNAKFNNNTTYVTFLNPEVINAWILDPAHFYKDGTKRVLFFTEQGTNSPDYSENSLRLQAAGAAWIWKKISRLDGIDAMQWHAWADNREEFGLRIGLRSFADGEFNNLDCKPVWYIWQAAGTDSEDEVFEPYLDVIEIDSWDNIVQPIE